MSKGGVDTGPASLLANLWKLNQRPNVHEILDQAGSLTSSQTVSALCVDQFQRWQRGERVGIEDLIRPLPRLNRSKAVVDLVVNEYLLRKEAGDRPDKNEYLNRFPHLSSELKHRLESHSEKVKEDKLSMMLGMDTSEVAAMAAAPRKFPELKNYEILSEVGRGGMGRVYKARHTRLDRIVALKLVNFHRLSDDERVIRRFEREARAAAQLNHPNIVLIYDFDFDEDNDLYYISMEYVEGMDLLRIVHENGPLSAEAACDYMRQASLGLHHAFENGMVHRDIKPPNLLVTASDTGPGRGVVKILDMGLVLIPEEGGSHLTQQGMVVGTPDYMAPEQTVDSHQVDIRADLYSLGCTLYHALTGQAPFAGCKMLQKLFMHQTSEPRPVEEFRGDLPPELLTVLHKMMAKDPNDRFQTPLELAKTLSEILSGKRKPAPQPPSLAEMILGDLEEQLNEGRMQVTPLPEPLRTVQAASARQQPESQQEPAEPEFPAPEKFVVFRGHQGWVTTLAFTPNRRYLASGGVDGSLRVWDLGSKAKDRLMPRAHADDVTALTIDSQSQTVATASGPLDGHIRLWDIANKIEKLGEVRVGMIGTDTLAFSPDGKLLASGGSDNHVRVFDVATYEPRALSTLKGHQSPIKVIAFDPDGMLLASAGQNGTVHLWNPSAFWSKEYAVLEGNWGEVHSLCFARDGRFFAFGSLDRKIYFCQPAEGKLRYRGCLEGHPGVVRCLQFNSDNTTLLSICDRGRAILWDIESGDIKRQWQLSRVGNFAVTRDGRYLATGGGDGAIALYRFYPRRDAD